MNVPEHVNAAERTLSFRTLESDEAHVLTLARTLPVPQEKLWSTVSTADGISQWFLPISGEPELGGQFQLQGNAGGTVQSCDPPNSYSATWEHGGQVSWITVSTTAVDPMHSRFHLEHVAIVPVEFWNLYGPGAVGLGWDHGLLGLALHLTSPGERPSDPLAWLVTDDGIQYCRLSANSWCAAQIARGDDPDEARRMAEASYNAYTATE